MMRKWRTDSYRYGLRLTYDIAIPLPGVRLWAQHELLAEIEQKLRTPLQFGLKPDELNYHDEALKVRAVVDEMPALQIEPPPVVSGVEPTDYNTASGAIRFGRIEFDVPEGYVIDSASLTATIAGFAPAPHFLPAGAKFQILNEEPGPFNDVPGLWFNLDPVISSLPNHKGKGGHRVVTFRHYAVAAASITIKLTFRRLDEYYAQWQRNVWQQIRAAAEARYAEEQARLQEERDRLWRLLNGKDTLSLRLLEREELLRLLLQWLLGPTYPVASTTSVNQTLSQLLANERTFQTAISPPLVPTFDGVDDKSWSKAVLFGEFVKFLQQAIEWENLLYFLYPYF